jgi:hypothetical protein
VGFVLLQLDFLLSLRFWLSTSADFTGLNGMLATHSFRPSTLVNL